MCPPHSGSSGTYETTVNPFATSSASYSEEARLPWNPATNEQHGLKDKGFLTTGDWHDITWEIGLDRMRAIVDGEVRFEGPGDYSGIESAPSVGPCFGSTVCVREFRITPMA